MAGRGLAIGAASGIAVLCVCCAALALSGCGGESTEEEATVATVTPSPTPTPAPAIVEPGATPTPIAARPSPTRTPRAQTPKSTATPTPSESAGVLEGRAIDVATSRPIEGVWIQLVPLPSGTQAGARAVVRETTTLRDGRFRFDGLEPGVYRVQVEDAERFLLRSASSVEERLTFYPRERRSGYDLLLYEGHRVRGVVRSADTGVPLSGVQVTATVPEGFPVVSGMTGRSGAYVLTGVPGPRVRLDAIQEGYGLLMKEGWEVVVDLPPDVREVERDLRMAPQVELTGTVSTPAGEGIPGARVDAVGAWSDSRLSAKGVTDRSGAFRLSVHPGLVLRVRATAPGHGVDFSRVVDLGRAPAGPVRIVLDRGTALSGRVGNRTGTGVAGARVEAWERLNFGEELRMVRVAESIAGTDGRYRLASLPRRRVVVAVRSREHGAMTWQDIDLAAEPDPATRDLLLESDAGISGLVIDVDGGSVAGALVSLEGTAPWKSETHTDIEGEFRLVERVPGRAAIRVEHPLLGMRRYYAEDGWTSGGLRLRLGAKGTYRVVGRVVDWSTGAAVEGLTVSCTSPGAEATFDPAQPGEFAIEGVGDDRPHVAWVKATGYPSVPWVLWPPASGESRPRVVVGPGASLRGRVVEKRNGRGIAGVDIVACGEWGLATGSLSAARLAAATTNMIGEFQLDEVAGGAIYLLIQPQGQGVQRVVEVEARHGTTVDVGPVEIQSR